MPSPRQPSARRSSGKRPPAIKELNESGSDTSVTLATQLRLWREKRMMTPDLLALRALVPLSLVEDLEAGIELFLAPAIRQRIARALHVTPVKIQDLEKPPVLPENSPQASNMRAVGENLYQTILQTPDAPHTCPVCSASLSVRLFERRDLQNRPLTVIKASCTACLFRLTDD